MKIKILDFIAGAQAARGLAVVIDVFRAFSVGAHAFGRGASAIVPVAEIETARELKARHPDWILLGERYGRPLPGFDCGNSPTELERFEVRGRTLVHTTHAGTQGLANARGADEVITGALVNAAAIVRYIRMRNPTEVSLVRMGAAALERTDEDDACAELIARRLRNEVVDTGQIRERLRSAPSAQKFFDPACDWAPERDFELCTQFDRFDFILKLVPDAESPRLTRVDVPR
jgi:2-phosphosulfolactate phosphatase